MGQDKRYTAFFGVTPRCCILISHDPPPPPIDWKRKQVHVKTSHRSASTAYHGVVPLASCLSSAGISVQERKGLMKMERQAVFQGGGGHTKARAGDRGLLGGSRSADDDGRSNETPLTSSGSDEGGTDVDGGGWAKGATRDEKTKGGCCAVSVTTSFVPHVVRKLSSTAVWRPSARHIAKCAMRRTRLRDFSRI